MEEYICSKCLGRFTDWIIKGVVLEEEQKMTDAARRVIEITHEQMVELKARGWEKDPNGYMKYLGMCCLACYKEGVKDGKAAAGKEGCK